MMDQEKLEMAFPASVVKERKGRRGQRWKYIKVGDVIKRLNEALEGEWSFTVEVVMEYPDCVIVKGRLEVNEVIKEQFGSKDWMRNDEGEFIDQGDDYKAAASDALKKCASLLGIPVDGSEDSGDAGADRRGDEDVSGSRLRGQETEGTSESGSVRDGDKPLSVRDIDRYNEIRRLIFQRIPKDLRKDVEKRHQWCQDAVGVDRMEKMTEGQLKTILRKIDKMNEGVAGDWKKEYYRRLKYLAHHDVKPMEFQRWLLVKYLIDKPESVNGNLQKKIAGLMDEMLAEGYDIREGQVKIAEAVEWYAEMEKGGLKDEQLRALIGELRRLGQGTQMEYFKRLKIGALTELDVSCITILGVVLEGSAEVTGHRGYVLPDSLGALGGLPEVAT